MLQFHWKKIGVCKHQSGITKILGTAPSCPMRPKYPHSPVYAIYLDNTCLNIALEWNITFALLLKVVKRL